MTTEDKSGGQGEFNFDCMKPKWKSNIHFEFPFVVLLITTKKSLISFQILIQPSSQCLQGGSSSNELHAGASTVNQFKSPLPSVFL